MDSDLEREIDRLLGATPHGRPGSAPPAAAQKPSILSGRRLLLALILAVVEAVGFIAMKPGAWLGVVVALLVLALAGWLWLRLRRGLLKDLVGIVALAQALVVAVPLAIAGTVTIGLIIGVALVVGIALVALRGGRGRR